MDDKWQRERDERCLDYSIEAFIRAWSPKDERARADFGMQLHSIVRMVYREAQRPLLNQMMIMTAAPLLSMLDRAKSTESQPVE